MVTFDFKAFVLHARVCRGLICICPIAPARGVTLEPVVKSMKGKKSTNTNKTRHTTKHLFNAEELIFGLLTIYQYHSQILLSKNKKVEQSVSLTPMSS